MEIKGRDISPRCVGRFSKDEENNNNKNQIRKLLADAELFLDANNRNN